MLINIMPIVLGLTETSIEFGKFFIDSPEADMNLEEPCTKLTNILKHESLPEYSYVNIIVCEFIDNSTKFNMDISQNIIDHIVFDSKSMEMAQIPVEHFYVDFRNQILQSKLRQFKNGEEIEIWLPSDLELSEYLIEICKRYGNNIEF